MLILKFVHLQLLTLVYLESIDKTKVKSEDN